MLRGLGILASEIRMWDILRFWVSYLGLPPHLGIPEMRILLGSGTEAPKVGSIDEHYLNASSVAEFRGLGYSAKDCMQLQGGGIVIKGSRLNSGLAVGYHCMPESPFGLCAE